MRRMLYVVNACAALTMISCADGHEPVSPRAASPANLDIEFGETEFTLEGVTYGPNAELVTPPSCSKINFFRDSTKIPTRQDLNNNQQQDDSTWIKWREGYSPGQCGLNYDPGGELYDGGSIFAAVIHDDVYTSLTAMRAVMNKDVKLLSVPDNSTIELSIFVEEGYRFLYWDVVPTSGAEYHVTNPVLYVPASSAGQRYIGVFQKGTNPNPPPPDSGGGTCIDPTQPGCDPG